MSKVCCIIVQGNNIYFVSKHYREIVEAIKNPEKFKELLKNKQYLDAGYLVLDFNNQTIINCQNATSLPKHKFDVVSI